jgi:Protein of unknown function (DUF1566)
MDVDANGRIGATTDGLLITRYLLGIRGSGLTSGALGAGASRTDPAEIADYLSTPCAQADSTAACSMDIDDNGRTDAATDGLLITRYLLGIRGSGLISDALGPGALRTDPAEIADYLSTPCAQAGWVGKGTGRLNDTGIRFGGEAVSSNNAGCTSTNTSIAQQDCSRGRDASAALNGAADGADGFSFTKISNSGNALSASAPLGTGENDWACTYDNVSGLMWEVKTTSGRRSSAHTYTWFSSDASNNAGAMGIANNGTCGDAGQCDTEKYALLTNLAGLCGRSDWRIPHVKELQSIVHYGLSSPSIDAVWFPNTPALDFWSNSPVAGGTTAARYVSFQGGFSGSGYRGFAYRVRLVRATQ